MGLIRPPQWNRTFPPAFAVLFLLATAVVFIAAALPPRFAPPAEDTSPDPAVRAGDWPQWGRDASKNMVADATGLPWDLDPGEILDDDAIDMTTTRNVLWVAPLGSQAFIGPTVARGRVFIGTNNEGRGDPRFKGDHSILKCLDASTGKVVWALTVPKLGTGKVGDWELLGICSAPAIVGDRVYFLTNRCELMCLDFDGLADGNQGDQDEGQYMSMKGTTPLPPVEVKPTDADIIWRYDIRGELSVYPHNITSSSPLVVGDLLFCATSNGQSYDHTDIPFPKAPSLIALDRKKAEQPGVTPSEILVGEEGSGLSKRILHASWTSPAYGRVDGQGIVLFGGPDGVLYAFDPRPVKDVDGFGVLPELWRHDCNPVHYRFKDGDPTKPIRYAYPPGDGPSEFLATPVVYKNRVYIAIGQDPEHGEGKGNLSCVDLKTGRKIWDFQGIDRSISTCSVVDDTVYIADFTGYVHSINADTGALHWSYDSWGEIWGSTLVAEDKLYIGNGDAMLLIFSLPELRRLHSELGGAFRLRKRGGRLLITMNGRTVRLVSEEDEAKLMNEIEFPDRIDATPVVAQNTLYISTMRHLYAIKSKP